MRPEIRDYAAVLRRSFQIACAMLPFIGLPAKAASVPILGAGATAPCSSWIWARRHQPAASDLQNWALGYFSGQEMAMSSNFLIGSNANILYTALDTQCQQEPNISVASAIDILVAQLKEGL